MLTIFGSRPTRSGYCDGVSRRGFLKIGALGVGAAGLNLADLYRADVLRVQGRDGSKQKGAESEGVRCFHESGRLRWNRAWGREK